MYENIPYLFDFWSHPFGHLLLLKSSMDEHDRVCTYLSGKLKIPKCKIYLSHAKEPLSRVYEENSRVFEETDQYIQLLKV